MHRDTPRALDALGIGKVQKTCPLFPLFAELKGNTDAGFHDGSE
jgi:hypothetical protein